MTGGDRHPMAACPSGWYAVALSGDVRAGERIHRNFAGRDVVIYRCASGRAVVSDAYCPHLGAHLGIHGRVVGEELACTFHGFRFDCSGACVATGYGTKPPPAARLATRTVVERNGAILVWHDASGAGPTWEVPALDWTGWLPQKSWFFEGLAAHAQDMTENSVDTGHFGHAHFFRDIEMAAPLALEGPSMTLHYRFKRPANPRTGAGILFDVEAKITAWAIGVTIAEAKVADFGLHNRVLVYHTPTSDGRIDVWVITSIRPVERPERMNPVLGALPRPLLNALVAAQVHRYTTSDIQGDFPYLSNKRYLARPGLAEGDGPIGRFRSWARQFYPEGQTP